ncbi:MAG: hypothetical protein IKK06_00590 [Clostridia bacterium]|nr:hypothetical protein [Clostridia bacterium]
MKNKNVAAEEVLEQNEVVAPVEGKKKKADKDKKELHSILFTVAWVVAVVALLFVLLGQNAMNNKDGYTSLSYHWFEDVTNRKTGEVTTEWTEQSLDIPFLTTSLCSIVALALGFISTVVGLVRNYIKKDKKLLSYLPGVITLVLAMMCYLSTVFTNA